MKASIAALGLAAVVLAACALSASPSAALPHTLTGGPVTITDSSAPPTAASPYPSSIVAGIGVKIVTDVDLELSNFAHEFPDEVDVLLVGPGGQQALVLSDTGASAGASATLTLDDQATASVPDPITSGTFLPTNVNDGSADLFPSPAPPGPYGSSLSIFNGVPGNGQWSLYVVDDALNDAGSIDLWRLKLQDRGPVLATLPTVPAAREDAGAARVTVVRRLPFDGGGVFAARVGYATEPLAPGTELGRPAVAGRDYTPVAGTLEFAPGETSKSFDVPLIDNRVRAPAATFRVRLTDASGDAALSSLDTPVQPVVIKDDEPEPAAPRISGRAVQRVLRQGAVVMTARFNLDGRIRATGTIALPRAASARSLRLKAVTRRVTANVPATLRLRLSPKAARAVRSALGKRSRLTASVEVVAVDTARTTSGEVAERRFKLKR
jgi:hypothetical protein